MITLTLFQVSTLITAFVSLFLGLFVYFSGEKTKLNFSWLLTSISISLWSIGLFGVVFSTNAITAWFWQYILDIGGICVPIVYFNFLLFVIKKEKKLLIMQGFSLIAGTALIVLNFTDLFKTGVSPKFGINYWIDPGKLYFLFPLYFFIFVIASTYVVIREYFITTDKDQRRRLVYILLAQIFGFGGGLTNFFPQLFNIYPFGNYFIILYVIFISYAALKHHLFNTKVIATELFTFTLWVLLSIKIFFSTSSQDLMLNVGTFFSVLLFGVLLIRGVLQEIKQKEQIEKMSENIRRAYEVEKKSKEELELLDKSKDQFLLLAQHQLRTPLSGIKWLINMLQGKDAAKFSAKQKEHISDIYQMNERMIRLVSDMLSVLRFEAGSVKINKEVVSIPDFYKEFTTLMMSPAKSKGVILRNLFENKGELKIETDSQMLKTILECFVSNAINYSESGQEVLLDAREEGDNVIFSVKDSGIGIPEEEQARISERFFRAANAKLFKPDGTGLGVYFASMLANKIGGRIYFESKKGQGSTFYLSIPKKIT